MTPAIIVVCIAVQLIASLGGDAVAAAIGEHAALVPARLTGHLAAGPGDLPAPLTLVTALFIHAGWVHLIVNLTFLLWVGRHVELVAGRARFIALYLVSGIVGGLVQVAVAPVSATPVVGASGAIAGVFAAYALLFGRRQIPARRAFGLTITGETIAALWYLATWIGLQLLIAVTLNHGEGGIAVWTHVGGFVVGLLAARSLGRRWR